MGRFGWLMELLDDVTPTWLRRAIAIGLALLLVVRGARLLAAG